MPIMAMPPSHHAVRGFLRRKVSSVLLFFVAVHLRLVFVDEAFLRCVILLTGVMKKEQDE